VAEVRRVSGQARAGGERGEPDLPDADDGQSGERDLQRVVVEDRDAGEQRREQDEVDRDRPDRRGLDRGEGE
jgi:hypothetical protein